jgi:hypothetical protein
VPILKASPKPPKNETLQLRVGEGLKSKLAKYAEFIDSSESYVVSEAGYPEIPACTLSPPIS